MQRVLITGGAGFIGSSLAGALMLSKNYHVTVLDNLSRGCVKNISRWLGSPGFEFVHADLLDNSKFNEKKFSTLQKVVDSSDMVFHLAANPEVAIGTENTHIDFQQNVQATYNLLEAIRKNKEQEKKANLCVLFYGIRKSRQKTYSRGLLSSKSDLFIRFN